MSPLFKLCAEPGCHEIIPIGTRRCPTHARADSTRRNQRTQRDGRHTAQWRRTRRLVLERDDHTCTRCGQPGNQGHSIVGGYHSTDPDDYETLCRSCHGHAHGGAHPQPPRR